MPLSYVPPRLHRSLQLVLFWAAISWAVAANLIATRAARGLTVRFNWSDEFLLLDAVFLVFLLSIGFALLQRIAARGTPLRVTLGLPRRPSSRIEWATGVAIGWGLALLAILPMAVGGTLHIRFWAESRSFYLALLNLATVALLALASELTFRGYPFQRLIAALGQGWATLAMSLLFGVAASYQLGSVNQSSTYLSTLISVLFGATLSLAWLRTHGLWLGWGLRFACMASVGVLFGLPVAGIDNLSSIVETRAIGPIWQTGGELGPDSALLTPILLVGAMIVVALVSRDWAWDYARKPLIPAGYPMDVPPPAAHEEMEKKAANTPALVQILPTTPQSRSAEREA